MDYQDAENPWTAWSSALRIKLDPRLRDTALVMIDLSASQRSGANAFVAAGFCAVLDQAFDQTRTNYLREALMRAWSEFGIDRPRRHRGPCGL